MPTPRTFRIWPTPFPPLRSTALPIRWSAAERSPIPNFTFNDGTSVGTNVNVPQETLIRKYQFSDIFSWTHGTHNMKMGANWIYFAKMGGYFYSGLGYFMTFWDDPVCIQAGACPQRQRTACIRRASPLREQCRKCHTRRAAVRPRSRRGVRWVCSSRMTGRYRLG